MTTKTMQGSPMIEGRETFSVLMALHMVVLGQCHQVHSGKGKVLPKGAHCAPATEWHCSEGGMDGTAPSRAPPPPSALGHSGQQAGHPRGTKTGSYKLPVNGLPLGQAKP